MIDNRAREIGDMLPKLRRFAFALTGSLDDADDLVQTACLKALDRLHQHRPGTRLDSWMYRIVQTSWLDSLRARKRRPAAPEDALETLCDGGLGARGAEARLELRAVARQMARLPEDQRAVLALVAIEGLSYREAASVLDLPIGTIMSRVARARTRLLTLREQTKEAGE